MPPPLVQFLVTFTILLWYLTELAYKGWCKKTT
nr:MAG TPA: hypothetical protein [Caudoviricetes sp.]